jgi:hypothetical protein
LLKLRTAALIVTWSPLFATGGFTSISPERSTLSGPQEPSAQGRMMAGSG